MFETRKSLKPQILRHPSLLPSIRALAHTLPPALGKGMGGSLSKEPKQGRKLKTAGALALALLIGIGATKDGQRGQRTDLSPTIVHGQALPKMSDSGKPQHWVNRNVVVTIDDSVDRLGPWARGAIQDAFGTWLASGVPVPDLTFSASKRQKLELKQDGVNSVVYKEIDIPGHTNDLAVTIAYSDPQTGEIVESDIIINKRHPFASLDELAQKGEEPSDAVVTTVQGSTAPGSTMLQRQASCSGAVRGGCGGKFDLQSVLTHEVGHFYGLSEDFEDPYTTMFECTSACETHKRVLAADDISAMSEIYTLEGSASEEDATTNAGVAQGCSATPQHAPARPWRAPWQLALGSGVLGLIVRRRFRS
ncbi:MAG: matrixin family metalloprotease [Polyangiaceae bacterium]|nr:matrixin family metalloprotease [Polyangiaceae bacterium]